MPNLVPDPDVDWETLKADEGEDIVEACIFTLLQANMLDSGLQRLPRLFLNMVLRTRAEDAHVFAKEFKSSM